MSTSWTRILESFHSALIDELNERLPNVRPELGMPLRQSQLRNPSAEGLVLKNLIAQIVAEPSGIVFLSLDAKVEKVLKISGPQDLWTSLMRRLGKEFDHRAIRPKFTPPQDLPSDFVLPKGFPNPSRTIWIPIGVEGGKCFLGLGV